MDHVRSPLQQTSGSGQIAAGTAEVIEIEAHGLLNRACRARVPAARRGG